MKPLEVRCNCGALFGIQQPDGSLSIKNRDLYRVVEGGTVSGPCRRCGAVVKWPTPQIIEKVR